MEWYLKVLRQYADFNGRARRQEYWMYVLFNILIAIGIITVGGILTLISGSVIGIGIFYFIYLLYALATFIPSLAVLVRRLHDTNNSGWMYFIAFIPLIGSIWLLVLLCTEGNQGGNNYGSDPKRESDIMEDINTIGRGGY